MQNRYFDFKELRRETYTYARAGVLSTPHGEVKTPTFMPVGTQAAVKSMTPDDLRSCGSQIILANTYHLYLRPGGRLIRRLGGLHEFTRWDGPILTDSGGYQVSSLGYFMNEREQQRSVLRSKIDNEGVTFRSHIDGSLHRFTAERSIEIQKNLGADIIMAFDEATPDKGKVYALQAMLRTHAWLERSIKKWQELESKKKRGELPQVLLGIIQGGNYRDLRRRSAKFVVAKDLFGIAVGGSSIGSDPNQTKENIDWIRDLIKREKPLYLMGVGVNPEDTIAAMESGADLFDCVAPTRLARMGHLYQGKMLWKGNNRMFESKFSKGRMNIGNSRFRHDKNLIDSDCDCYTCERGFSRAYLYHLFKIRELVYYRLATLHNLRFMMRLCERLRESIT